MKARHHQIIATLALVLALSAVLVGSANAADRPDNRAGVLGIGSQAADLSDVFTRAVARARAAQAVRPDDRAGPRGAGISPSAAVAIPDVFERAVLRHDASTPVRPDDRAGPHGIGSQLADSAPIATTAGSGFEWLDAGLGAAATLALILVIAGVAVARASHQRNHAILD
jgi:hypothetical protein